MQERRMDVVEVLSFLFMLSTMELGRVRGHNSIFRQLSLKTNTIRRTIPQKI